MDMDKIRKHDHRDLDELFARYRAAGQNDSERADHNDSEEGNLYPRLEPDQIDGDPKPLFDEYELLAQQTNAPVDQPEPRAGGCE